MSPSSRLSTLVLSDNIRPLACIRTSVLLRVFFITGVSAVKSNLRFPDPGSWRHFEERPNPLPADWNASASLLTLGADLDRTASSGVTFSFSSVFLRLSILFRGVKLPERFYIHRGVSNLAYILDDRFQLQVSSPFLQMYIWLSIRPPPL